MTIDQGLKGVMETFNQLLRENPYELNLKRQALEERLEMKKALRKALRDCVYGDKNAKTYVKDYIKDILIRRYKVDKENIEEMIPFSDLFQLTAQDKFDILLYFYEKDYKNLGLEQMITEYGLDSPKGDGEEAFRYEISKEDIHRVYEECPFLSLAFADKLNIISQRIYQSYKGNGVIDEIRDMKIDGVSAGVSGIPEGFDEEILKRNEFKASYDSIWLFYHGKSIYLSFLSFQSYQELMRVCRNIYRYNNPGQLSQAKGYMVNEMKDGSRVAVARPPFCESWVLFVRKFDTVLQENIHNLLTDENSHLPIQIMKWLIKGCMVCAVTGQQGSGKTTLLMSLIGFINPMYNLRIQELSFELHLRKIYPTRNIVTFRETEGVKGGESLDFLKKTDGTVTILGEVATDAVSVWLIKAAQVASLFTLFTHHAKTAENLVIAMRNALLMEGGFQNERIATKQVADAINFDIHMKKDLKGHRYIERITEILPLKEDMFDTRDIVVFENERYIMKNQISEKSRSQIREYLSKEELCQFEQCMMSFTS